MPRGSATTSVLSMHGQGMVLHMPAAVARSLRIMFLPCQGGVFSQMTPRRMQLATCAFGDALGVNGKAARSSNTLRCFFLPPPPPPLRYIADSNLHRIRRVSRPPGALMTTIAGGGAAAYVESVGSNAQFNNPSGVAAHPTSGWVFVAGAFRFPSAPLWNHTQPLRGGLGASLTPPPPRAIRHKQQPHSRHLCAFWKDCVNRGQRFDHHY